MIHLDRLELHGFKQFADKKEFRFSDGINVITGPNEAGKSTVLDGILTALFGLKPADTKSYFSWNNGNTCTVKLEFNIDDDTYQIKRDLREDKSGLWKKDAQAFTEISKDKKKIAEFVDKHFGFKEWRVFANTLVIGQNDITIFQPKTPSEKTTFNKLKQIIERATAGSKDVDSSLSKIIEKVTDLHGNLVSLNRRNAQIPRIKQEIDNVNEQLERARNYERNLAQNTAEKEIIEEELASKEAKLKTLEQRKELYDAKERIQNAKEDIEGNIRQKQRALENIKTLRDGCAQLENEAKPLEIKYKNITDDIERDIHKLTTSCEDAKKRIAEKEQNLEKINRDADNEREKKNLYPGFDNLSEDDIQQISTTIEMWKNTCSKIDKSSENTTLNSNKKSIIAVVLVMAGIIGGIILGNIVAGVIAGLVLVAAAYILFSTKDHDDVREGLVKEKEGYEDEFSQIKVKIPSFDQNTFQDISKKYMDIVRPVEGLYSRINQMETDLEKEQMILKSHNDELNQITKSLPGFSYEDFKTEFPQLKEKRSDIKAKNEALDNLLVGSSEEEINQELMKNTSEILKLDKEWNEKNLGYANFSADEINEIVNIKNIKKDAIGMGQKCAELSGRINESAGAGNNAIALEETIESLREQQEKLVHKASVVEILRTFLIETDNEIKARFAPQVAEKMEHWLSNVTNSKYAEMSLNSDLKLSVKIPETGDFVNLDTLSRGTQDQVYLGLRLVIGDLISGKKNVPVFLDDTMQTFDAMRLASAKILFEEVAQDRQVFVLSHDEAYKNWGEERKIIEL